MEIQQAQSGNSGPAMPLIKTTGQIKLKMRKNSFEKEIAGLPNDLSELQELLLEARLDRNAAIYQMVSAWNKLRTFDKYWESFGCKSEYDYLVSFALPDGDTLGTWTVMVNLFDKDTFILLGDQVLEYMMRSVTVNQPDTEKRKADYKAIFAEYCAENEGFNKSKFFDVVKQYIRKTYEENPVITPSTPSVAKVGSFKSTLKKQVTEQEETQHECGAPPAFDITWVNANCKHCAVKITALQQMKIYAEKLEQVIREQLGKKYLPARPEAMRHI